MHSHDLTDAVCHLNALLSRIHFERMGPLLCKKQTLDRLKFAQLYQLARDFDLIDSLWPYQQLTQRYRLLLTLFLQINLGAPRERQAALSNDDGLGDITALVGHELFALELQSLPTGYPQPERLTPRRLQPSALDLLLGQRYGRAQQVVARWYGVVLLIAEESNQVCAWCPVTSTQGVSHGSPQQPTE